MIEADRIVTASSRDRDEQLDRAIRPLKLAEYIGQPVVREQMDLFIRAAKGRQEALDHTLIFGPPGLGKTTLANIIAEEMGVSIKSTSGPVLERPGDLAALLTNLEAGDVLFVDEIHRFNKAQQDAFLPLVEDGTIVLVGATTENPSFEVNGALRSRLHDVFLELVVDEDAGIAFTRHVRPDNEDVKVPPVLRTEALTHLQTAILLQLRHELGMSTPGERVVVGEDELYGAISYVRAVDNRDESGFKKRFTAAVNTIRKYSLLTDTETEGRWEVSPVLRHIFDADTVHALREEYLRLAQEGEEQ